MNMTCFFTGHRNIEPQLAESIKNTTAEYAIRAIDRGFTEFWAGGAVGFDMIAAETVLQLKKLYPISLNLALPYKNQQLHWSQDNRLKYERFIDAADQVVYIANEYDRGCFYRRNRYMADRSALCISYFNGQPGGTFYTVKYAVSKGIEILFI